MKGGNKLLAQVRHPRLRLIDYVLRRKIIISPITPFDCAKGEKRRENIDIDARVIRQLKITGEKYRLLGFAFNVSNVLNEFIMDHFDCVILKRRTIFL